MPDFAKQQKGNNNSWYDLRGDWGLIEASFATQYGIRIRQHTDMPWTEFCTLVSGLMPDTPLGSIVTIRSEKDPKTIKKFTPEQRKIHREWQLKLANMKLDNPENYEKEMANLAAIFTNMFCNIQ